MSLVVALLALGAPLSASADVVGSGPGTISGTATSTDGQPLQGVFVNVSISFGEGTAFSASTLTDAAGSYEFSGLDAGTYSVSASLSGFQNAPWQEATVSASSPTAVVDFAFTPFEVGLGSVSGIVTADGAPLVGLGVTAANYTTGQYQFTTTDENGVYSIAGLANGQWNIQVMAGPEYQFIPTINVQISDASPAATADIALITWPAGTASISGTVVNASTGAPIDGVNINIFGASGSRSTTSGSDGTYEFPGLADGSYQVNVYVFGQFVPVYLPDVPLAAGQALVLDLPLTPANSSISGRIVKSNGSPIADLYVSAAGENNGQGAMTDANGEYLITGLGDGPHTVFVGGIGTPYVYKEKSVTTVADGNVTKNFTLATRTTGAILGFVRDAAGFDLPGACVTLYKANKKQIVATGAVGPDGTYTFDNLAPGSYKVKAKDCDHSAPKHSKEFYGGASKWKDAASITVVAATDFYEADIDLDLKP